jgi:hypothetical protein
MSSTVDDDDDDDELIPFFLGEGVDYKVSEAGWYYWLREDGELFLAGPFNSEAEAEDSARIDKKFRDAE